MVMSNHFHKFQFSYSLLSGRDIDFVAVLHMNRVTRKLVFGFPARSDTKLAVQSQKMVRDFRFLMVWYCLYCKNKGAEKLHGYPAADLRLVFRIYKKSRYLHSTANMSLVMFCIHVCERYVLHMRKQRYRSASR